MLQFFSLVFVKNSFALNQSLTGRLGKEDFKSSEDTTLNELESRDTVGASEGRRQAVHEGLGALAVKDGRAGLIKDIASQFFEPVQQMKLVTIRVTQLSFEIFVLYKIFDDLLAFLLDLDRHLYRFFLFASCIFFSSFRLRLGP